MSFFLTVLVIMVGGLVWYLITDFKSVRINVTLWFHNHYPVIYLLLSLSISLGVFLETILTDIAAFLDIQMAFKAETDSKALLSEVVESDNNGAKSGNKSGTFIGVTYKSWGLILFGVVFVVVLGVGIYYGYAWVFGGAGAPINPPFTADEIVLVQLWGNVPTKETINNASPSQIVDWLQWVASNPTIAKNSLVNSGVFRLNVRLEAQGVANTEVKMQCIKHFLGLVYHEGYRPLQAVQKVCSLL